jgi:hypothetical protein
MRGASIDVEVDDICVSSPSADLELHALGRRCGEMLIEMELGFHGRPIFC